MSFSEEMYRRESHKKLPEAIIDAAWKNYWQKISSALLLGRYFRTIIKQDASYFLPSTAPLWVFLVRVLMLSSSRDAILGKR